MNVNMEFELRLKDKDGNEVVHEKNHVSGLMLLDALELQESTIENGKEEINLLANHAAKVFGIKKSEIIEGLDARVLRSELLRIFYLTLGWAEKKIHLNLQMATNGEAEED